MALSFLNIFKKEEKETETAKVEGFDPKANAEEKKEETSKGGHGGGTCCGSCS
ncbi:MULTISPECIES: CCGSCS motif protein [unclassified Marinobacter]|jgi:CCGSCS motif protein|uniref:CCGSCS motif protein n=1 Tax=unclassified Marinobacter TaxID=83889 RepID=UPI0009EC8C9B|nr:MULTISPECIES: CCGSCS motif protein [unclassified Marinobacter]HBM49345.1 CCGSCS motif protein [Marinobacter sp.]|tara:strand:- start:104 stop:262 length:159 start_codon:yes stop_codon:yes gene_type:complete